MRVAHRPPDRLDKPLQHGLDFQRGSDLMADLLQEPQLLGAAKRRGAVSGAQGQAARATKGSHSRDFRRASPRAVKRRANGIEPRRQYTASPMRLSIDDAANLCYNSRCPVCSEQLAGISDQSSVLPSADN